MSSSLTNNTQFTLENGVHFQRGIARPGAFERKYFQLRLKEGRIYPDTVVVNLPDTDRQHIYAREWKARHASMSLLLNYLKTKTVGTVLEIGCGNGWLSHRIAGSTSASVVGLDCNETELNQAAGLFKRENLSFVYGDIFTCPLPASIDVIIMASSLQYFKDFSEITERCFQLLTEHGELHILDTPVYENEIAAKAAARRSHQYFQNLGMEEMSTMYFHHLSKNFERDDTVLLFDPRSVSSSIRRRVFRQELPAFPWFRMKKEKA